MAAVEPDIRGFWQTHPCGDSLIGGLKDKFSSDYASFFDAYDTYRYTKEAHILTALDRFDFKGKKVLEIGLGQGADSEQLIKRGAIWSGLDLTQEAVDRLKTRMAIRKLPHGRIERGSVLNAPFPDKSFDIVFSHGVLHHVPDILAAQREIHRMLKPGGKLIVMMYARHSLNYHLAIKAVRRLGLLGLYATGIRPGGIYNRHLELAREHGLWNYLKLKNFVHRSTDGPDNPYSKLYTAKTLAEDFPLFDLQETFKLWLYHPPIPTTPLPLGHLLGWHLWGVLTPKPA
jgi:ubiquinone/menaquinone biosynthesis C-methylase UbiE